MTDQPESPAPSEPDTPPPSEPEQTAPVPALQRLFDNPWLLLLLGLVIPTLSYTVWGLIELMLLPQAKLP